MNYPYNNYNPYTNYQYQPSAQNNTYAFVNGIEGAKSYLMQPNQTVLLMDSDAPMCYMKTANGMGQATIRCFKLEEITDQPSQTQNFASKSDFDSLSERLSELEKKLAKKGGVSNE